MVTLDVSMRESIENQRQCDDVRRCAATQAEKASLLTGPLSRAAKSTRETWHHVIERKLTRLATVRRGLRACPTSMPQAGGEARAKTESNRI